MGSESGFLTQCQLNQRPRQTLFPRISLKTGLSEIIPGEKSLFLPWFPMEWLRNQGFSISQEYQETNKLPQKVHRKGLEALQVEHRGSIQLNYSLIPSSHESRKQQYFKFQIMEIRDQSILDSLSFHL